MTDYQKLFLKKMEFVQDEQACRRFYAPSTNTGKGYFISYQGENAYQFVLANYLISKSFELTFNSNHRYLRLGVVEKGVSNYVIDKKQITEFSPSPFLVMETSISGKQVWESGHHYKESELIIDMSLLKEKLLSKFPELIQLDALKEDFIYYYLPNELIGIFETLKQRAISNTLTPLYLEALVLKCLAILSEEISASSGNPFINHYNYSVIMINKDRTIRLSQQDIDAIHKAQKTILKHLDNPPSITALSKKLYISEQKLTIGFKKVYGQSIGQFMLSQKLAYAAQLLTTTDLSIYEIAQKVGYVNTSNFSKAFKRSYEKSPLKYRNSRH